MSNESVLACKNRTGYMNMTKNWRGDHLHRQCPRAIIQACSLQNYGLRFWTQNSHTSVITNLQLLPFPYSFPYLAGLVVEPDQGVIPGENFAVKGGVVLGRPTASHRPADLDRLIQVHMSLLEWMRVGSAGKHSQRRRH